MQAEIRVIEWQGLPDLRQMGDPLVVQRCHEKKCLERDRAYGIIQAHLIEGYTVEGFSTHVRDGITHYFALLVRTKQESED